VHLIIYLVVVNDWLNVVVCCKIHRRVFVMLDIFCHPYLFLELRRLYLLMVFYLHYFLLELCRMYYVISCCRLYILEDFWCFSLLKYFFLFLVLVVNIVSSACTSNSKLLVSVKFYHLYPSFVFIRGMMSSLQMYIPITYIMCWYKTLLQVEPVV